MILARFLYNNRVEWGIVDGDDVLSVQGSIFSGAKPGDRLCALSEVRLLAPIDPRANKVPAIAANYGERDERDGPGIFMKQPGTVVGPGDPIVYPRIGRSIIHEAEVGIVIGKSARHVSTEDALDHVLGYTCVNDVSARELASSDLGRGTSMRWKHFDSFCPIGPWIVTGLDGDNLGIECRVNGETVVEGSTSDMLWGVAKLISWVSEVMVLHPGDIIPSGCPDTDEIAVGDTVDVVVEGIGTLRNPVVADL